MFSNRLNKNIEENKVSKLLKSKKSNGIKVLDLTESNPTNSEFKYNINNILKFISNPNSEKYFPSPKGLETARIAVLKYYKDKNINLDIENIFLTSSTSEAYSYIFKLLTNPFDEILIPRPSYPLFSFILELESLHSKYYDLIYSNNNVWEIDYGNIESQITNKTKAIIIVNPNNPTGNYIKRNELDNIINICKENNIAIISDEVFIDYTINSNEINSITKVNDVLTFTLSGLSKICGLPQMKLSWFVLNGEKEICEEAKAKLEIITDTFLTVGTPIQLAAQDILRERNIIQQQIKKRINKNYEFLEKRISNSKFFELLFTEGGWYSIFKLKEKINEEEYVFKLLEKKDVYIYPGYYFDFCDDGFIVVSLLTPENIFNEGVDRILEFAKSFSF